MVLMIFASILYEAIYPLRMNVMRWYRLFYGVEFDSLQGSLNRRMEYAQDMVYIGNSIINSKSLRISRRMGSPCRLSNRFVWLKPFLINMTRTYPWTRRSPIYIFRCGGTEIKDSSDGDVKQVYNSFPVIQ